MEGALEAGALGERRGRRGPAGRPQLGGAAGQGPGPARLQARGGAARGAGAWHRQLVRLRRRAGCAAARPRAFPLDERRVLDDDVPASDRAGRAGDVSPAPPLPRAGARDRVHPVRAAHGAALRPARRGKRAAAALARGRRAGVRLPVVAGDSPAARAAADGAASHPRPGGLRRGGALATPRHPPPAGPAAPRRAPRPAAAPRPLSTRARGSAAGGGLGLGGAYRMAETGRRAGPEWGRLRGQGREPPPARRWRRAERGYYRHITPPDVIIVLMVDPQVAVRRKTTEPPDYVRARARIIWETDWTGTGAHLVDAGRPLPEVVADLKVLVWSEV